MPSRLAELRTSKGLSQAALSRAAVVSVRTIRRIESDPEYETSLSTARRLARALGVSLDLLTHAADDGDTAGAIASPPLGASVG